MRSSAITRSWDCSVARVVSVFTWRREASSQRSSRKNADQTRAPTIQPTTTSGGLSAMSRAVDVTAKLTSRTGPRSTTTARVKASARWKATGQPRA
ncbi:hypothetical protein [Corynebacterium variabile]